MAHRDISCQWPSMPSASHGVIEMMLQTLTVAFFDLQFGHNLI